MSFIKDEIDRINKLLVELKQGELYDKLYVAQQALTFALDPRIAKGPYDFILKTGMHDEMLFNNHNATDQHPIQN